MPHSYGLAFVIDCRLYFAGKREINPKMARHTGGVGRMGTNVDEVLNIHHHTTDEDHLCLAAFMLWLLKLKNK